MGRKSVKRGNVIESKLTQGGLKDLDSSFGLRICGIRGRIYCFYDLVDL